MAPVTERVEVASVPQLLVAVAVAAPPANEPRLVQVTGGVNEKNLPEAGVVVMPLFAVTVLAVLVVSVMLWKLVAVRPVQPTEALVELAPIVP